MILYMFGSGELYMFECIIHVTINQTLSEIDSYLVFYCPDVYNDESTSFNLLRFSSYDCETIDRIRHLQQLQSAATWLSTGFFAVISE